MKKRVGIKQKIILGIISVFLLSGLINIGILFMSLYKSRESGIEGIKKMASLNARDNLNSMERILDLKQDYQGGWQIKDGKLYKGETKINDNEKLVDEFANLYKGSTITIFQGNIRVATNVIKEGKRAIGTKVSEIVEERVIKKGTPYYGEANVVGNQYVTAYHPIKDVNTGKIIGIFYTGVPANEIKVHEDELLKTSIYIAVGNTIVTVVILLLALIVVTLITSSSLKPLKEMSISFKELASGHGDLTKRVEITSSDEIGNLGEIINLFVNSLDLLMNNVKTLSDSLNKGTHSVSSNLNSVVSNVTEIFEAVKCSEIQMTENSASIEEISATIEEISNSATRQLDQALEAKELSKEVYEESATGEKMLKDLIESLKEISRTNNKTIEDNKTMKVHSSEILKIVEAIEEIANKTNLLSLNASIEASRAGEAGKGFSVVAEEIRTLASNSQKAVDGIKKVASNILTTTEDTFNNLRESEIATNEGMDKVIKIDKIIENTLSRVKEVSDKVEEITLNTENNTSGLQEISAAVMNSAQNTSETSSQISNISDSSKDLKIKTNIMVSETNNMIEKVEELYKMIKQFKTSSK